MKLIRVFPRKTRATPDDDLVVINKLPTLFEDKIDKVLVSVTFSWDVPLAEELARQWSLIAPTEIGGPAMGTVGEEFTPGLYIKHGYVITSRGCHNKCWFCDVWKREGLIRELKIHKGNNILDDNLLACSEKHIKNVFTMLRDQKTPIELTGGLEAAIFKPWHVDLLLGIKLKQMFFAYDDQNDLEPLTVVSKLLKEANIIRKSSRKARCYVLIGYPGDTMGLALKRLEDTYKLGFMPMAMLYRDKKGHKDKTWGKFQREWAHPIILGAKAKLYDKNW